MKYKHNLRYFHPLQSGITIALLLAVASCGQKTFDSEAELWEYVKNPSNGYYHEKTIGPVHYALIYRPTDLQVKQELKEDTANATIDSLRKKYGKYLYFNLTMSANRQELLSAKANDRMAFGHLVNELSFGMAEKVHLLSKRRDTIPILDYTYPRMYGMSNSTNILLVYPKDQRLFEENEARFTIEDLGFSTGEVGFNIPTSKLDQEPKLNLKKTL
ncbi:hypothetical protein GTQ34_16245 [Muricauda sp. JGD-17]|uniref:Lipoprotein n=1 Tax=Flagellimonas ochracea TaxID=2696472 RepID=A0A964TEH6_9FLAO|nr:hypothetical protein [Allomuricauda ochracea]NAY93463.1 hypothetical protein [Allomuricauda ochracea]